MKFHKHIAHTPTAHIGVPAPASAPAIAPDVAAPSHSFGAIAVTAAPQGAIQPKLTVGAAHDPYEDEADRVAGQVMRLTDAQVQRVTPDEDEDTIRAKPGAQRLTPDEDEDTIRAKPGAQRTAECSFDASAAAEARIAARRGGGSPLPDSTRAFMEPRFRASFAGVRIHADAEADQISQNLSARAFTTGQDIYFRQGEYRPGSSSGQALLAHELTHVVQQGRGRQAQHKDLRVQRFSYKLDSYDSKHNENNQEFIKRKSPFDPNDPSVLKAYAAAILLDHDMDTREVLKQDWLPVKKKLKAEYNSNRLVMWVAQLLLDDLSPSDLYEMIRAGIKADKNTYSEFKWGPMINGQGSYVTADLKPNGHPEGSDAGGWNPWIYKLAHRADTTSTLYVRGHLLNRHLGGPGLDYNMVPLTGRGGWFGANNANRLHSEMIEQQIKGKFEMMSSIEVDETLRVQRIFYEVIVERNDRQRNATSIVAKTTDEFIKFRDDIKNLLLDNSQNNNIYYDLMNEDRLVDVHNQKYGVHMDQNVSTDEIKSILKQNFVNDNLNLENKISSWSNLLQRMLDRRVNQNIHLKNLLKAVTPDQNSNYKNIALLSLVNRMEANRDLWMYEDKEVPTSLRIAAKWNQGDQERQIQERVRIDLPDQYNAPWHPERQNPEDEPEFS